MLQSRDQAYAAQVYSQIEKLLGHNRKEQKQYGSMSHKLPVLIRSAGLAQALAFVSATAKRGKEGRDGAPTKWSPQRQLLDDLAQSLNLENADRLLTESRKASLDEYMFLTQNALTALLWYKRFAQSVLNVESSDEPDDADEDR
jgi:CRISPR-associated protein Cmr5